MDLVHCHGNLYDVTRTLKVKPNNRVARSCKETLSLPTPSNIILCNRPSFHKYYSNEKPFSAPLNVTKHEFDSRKAPFK